MTARSGELVVAEPGIYHRFANVGDEPAVVRVRVTPALRMEELFETVAVLAAEGRTLPSGMPRPLDLALFMREFRAEVVAPVAPGLAGAVMTPLAAIGQRRGLARYHALPAGAAVGRPVPMHSGVGRVSGTRPGNPRSARHEPSSHGRHGRSTCAARQGCPLEAHARLADAVQGEPE